ncbi:MAG: RNA polymerase-binding protein DksA [Coxiellaceae bacterium]|nr:RNA polymerase-binding protein DksA [Coxiellaceae bacterium]
MTKKVATPKTTASAENKPAVRKRPVNAAAGPLGFTPYVEKKGEEYMAPAHVEHFRNILELWKRQLMEEVDSTVGHMKEDDNNYADPVDRASMEADFNLELRTRDRERKLIRKIESVMDDLDRGEYGYCEDCGADIGIRRLEARPTATKCIDCKTFQEIKEKQGA